MHHMFKGACFSEDQYSVATSQHSCSFGKSSGVFGMAEKRRGTGLGTIAPGDQLKKKVSTLVKGGCERLLWPDETARETLVKEQENT